MCWVLPANSLGSGGRSCEAKAEAGPGGWRRARVRRARPPQAAALAEAGQRPGRDEDDRDSRHARSRRTEAKPAAPQRRPPKPPTARTTARPVETTCTAAPPRTRHQHPGPMAPAVTAGRKSNGRRAGKAALGLTRHILRHLGVPGPTRRAAPRAQPTAAAAPQSQRTGPSSRVHEEKHKNLHKKKETEELIQRIR